jgi:hypothetical protein
MAAAGKEACVSKPYVDYYEYIASDKWREKAREAKEATGYRCQLCNASYRERTLHVHHRTYENLGNETTDDLTVLCGNCHRDFHKKHGPGPEELEREILMDLMRRHGIKSADEMTEQDDPWQDYIRAKYLIHQLARLRRTDGQKDWKFIDRCMDWLVDYLHV